MTSLALISASESFYSTRRLLEAAAARGLPATVIDPGRVVLAAGAIGDRPRVLEGGAPVSVPEVVVPRVGATLTEWGLAIHDALCAAGARSPVTSDAIRRAQDKLAAATRLQAAGVPIVPTLAVREPAHLRDAWDALGGGPAVVKLRHGTKGRHVVPAPTRDVALAAAESLIVLGHTVLLQPWIGHGIQPARDLRVLVAGGEAIAACWRIAPAGTFRANVHRGARAEPAELDEALAALARDAARAVELPLCGVDVLPTAEGGLAVLEVNGSPGLEGIEAATGRDLAAEVLASVLG